MSSYRYLLKHQIHIHVGQQIIVKAYYITRIGTIRRIVKCRHKNCCKNRTMVGMDTDQGVHYVCLSDHKKIIDNDPVHINKMEEI